ncbi:MAG: double-strand break repair helicase AddA [Hyphomicrobium sp.]
MARTSAPRAAARSIGATLAETGRHQSDASNPELSVWVSANAGTGKTHVLTMRVLRLLLNGNRPESILCLTYTKAAAAEMSKRVFDELARWVTMEETALKAVLHELTGRLPTADEMARARTLFTAAIETPGGLKIQTVHAFAEKLLQQFPLEAGVAPGFAILADDEARRLRREAIDGTLGAASREHGGPLGEALEVAIAYAADDRFDAILGEALAERAWLDAAERMGFDEAEKLLRGHFGVPAGVSLASLATDLAELIGDSDLRRLNTALNGGGKSDAEAALHVQAALRATAPAQRAAALGNYFLTGTGEPRKSLMTKAVKTAHPDLDGLVTRVQGRYVALKDMVTALDAITASLALYRLADDVMRRYGDAKARRAALDFDDLIAKAGSLLSDRVSTPWVLYKLDSGLAHILVDESQDTAPTQWRIIAALADEFFSGAASRDEVRTLFAVGDEKQSIYSFQGAEAEEFARMGRQFETAAIDAKVKWRTVPLTLSFRTVEPVLKAVDQVFADPARTPGVTASARSIEHLARRVGQQGLVELWPTEGYTEPPAADPWLPLEAGAEVSPAVRLANRIADQIRGWLDSGARLGAEDRPIQPGDILILVRKRNPFAAPMTAALKARRIPVAGSDRVRLAEQIAVQDLMALGDFLTLPEDDLALASVLKSPLFGMNDDDLLAIASGRKGTLWKALLAHADGTPAFGAAAATLKEWRRRAGFTPPYEFFAGLLDNEGLRAKLLARLGPDAGDAIDEFVNLALTYDDQEPPSLSGFLHWLRDGTREIKRDMDHGRNEVRVMTVHGAKGLEAPIVFLPDTCTTASAGSRGGGLITLAGASPPETPAPFVWCVKGSAGVPAIAAARAEAELRETGERNRLLYVAMTRARDRLYVAGFEGKQGRRPGCWYDLIEAGLGDLLAPVELPEGRSVRRLSAQQTAPHETPRVRQDEAAPASPLPDWARRPAPREAQLAVPLAPSRLAPYELDDDGEPLAQPLPKDRLAEPPDTPRAPPKMRSPREDDGRFLRGTLTHALLQHLPGLDADTWPAAARRFLDRRAGQLLEHVRAGIARETLALLTDSRFAPLFGPASQAEVPVVATIPRPSGSGPALKLTGQIDRLADTGREVLIIDYKTNRLPPSRVEDVAEVYLLQLAAYRLALGHIFDKPVRAALLWTETPRLMPVPDELLGQFERRLWTLDAAGGTHIATAAGPDRRRSDVMPS